MSGTRIRFQKRLAEPWWMGIGVFSCIGENHRHTGPGNRPGCEDPSGGPIEGYRKTRDIIKEKVKDLNRRIQNNEI